MRIKAKEYLVLIILLCIGCAASIVLCLAVFKNLSGNKRAALTADGVSVINRTLEVTGGSEDDSEVIISRIDSGMMTVGDYVTKALTDAEFILNDSSDDCFAQSLARILYGDEASENDSNEIKSMLREHSRQYVIAEEIAFINSDYAPVNSVDDSNMSRFNSCTIDRPLTGSDGYTIGIRLVRGHFDIEGDEVRTDFFVDGTLYQGYLKISEENESSKDFSLAWDTSGVSEGEHKVNVLLRTSDGNGVVLDGGDIYIPHIMPLKNDNVQHGSVQPESDCSWYYLDAQERNAYVNFVDMNEDVKATIYDAYGDAIGCNDIPNMKNNKLVNYEILRGHKQDTDQISEETGISSVANVFYIKVERGEQYGLSGSDNGSEEVEIKPLEYTMVQSRDAAIYNGNFVSVNYMPDGYTAVLTDLNLNTYETATSDFSVLPVNGRLIGTDFVNSSNGNNVNVMPVFDKDTFNYAFYSSNPINVAVNCKIQDGYCGQLKIVSRHGIDSDSLMQGQNTEVTMGESVVDIEVTDFDGEVNTYRVYFLVGDDSGDFCETTLAEFPESYYSGLWLLHSLHPDYIFRAYNTGLSFQTVMNNEDNGSRSLANVNSHPGWTVSSSPVYDNGGWKMAKTSVVQYFVDPRNMLDEKHIFAFELQSFDASCQTIEGVKSMIEGSFMDTSEEDYAQIIYDAGANANVSPYLLASRIIQEMGYGGISDLCHGTVPGYEGYYNFYNIGSTPDPNVANGAVINGAKYAMWGKNPEEQEITPEEASLYLPWNSPRNAIFGGALWIASRYTAQGQDTLYFQKFDVVDDENGLYEHQYAQNISMAYTEGVRYYDSYAAIDMIDSGFTFLIPVYTDMPVSFGVMPEA
ncbi:MAG: hypothetical protein MJ153_01100 [Clostridia bacterium]|nr:hypothetical protein [Clostridia bacterium]